VAVAIYLAINAGRPSSPRLGREMSTDTAFASACFPQLSCRGSRTGSWPSC